MKYKVVLNESDEDSAFRAQVCLVVGPKVLLNKKR
jgi:hypothetical protein